MCLRKNGFTLVEVLVASVIGVFVAVVAIGALKAVSASSEAVADSARVAAELRFASSMVAADLMNLYRDGNVDNMRLIGRAVESAEGAESVLTLYTVGRAKARPGQPEGDVYEVEYHVLRDGENSRLMRRLWPNPEKEVEPGGVLMLLAEGIDVFEVTYFDGRQWQTEWPEDFESVPEMVEVTLGARQPGRPEAAVETFVVNFARPIWAEGDDVTEQGQGEESREDRREQD